jgi:uncharacterized membrane protein YhhN
MSPGERAPWRRALLIGAAICAPVAIGAELLAPEQATLAQWARPLASGLLVLFAATTRDSLSAGYRTLITTGLLLSLAADLLVRQPSDPFVPALALSLGAVAALFAAFTRCASTLRYKAGVVGYAAVATVVLALLSPVIGGTLRTVLIAHVIVLSLTASQAASWMLEDLGSRSARLAAFGASCLVASHSVLVLDRFVFIVPAASLLVLAPYWIALACLALSVERPPPPALRL